MKTLPASEVLRRLKETHTYDPQTGIFARIHHDKANRQHSKRHPGLITWNGYRVIKIDFVAHRAHRLAWLYVHGEWPAGFIDHINCDKLDNRISNLRIANKSQNGMNRGPWKNGTSGYKGVTYDKNRRSWHAQIGFLNKNINIGNFPTAQMAADAYSEKAKQLHGEFARTA